MANIGVGIILQHLEGMTLVSNDVDGNGVLSLMATSVDGNFSGTGTLSLMKLKLVLWLDKMVWRRGRCMHAEMWWPSKAHLTP